MALPAGPFRSDRALVVGVGKGAGHIIDQIHDAGSNVIDRRFADKIGLEKVLRWMENLYGEFGNSRYIASPILKKLVRGNKLGRSTCSGFYEYNCDGENISKKTVEE